MWETAESQLRAILKELNIDFYEAEGEAAAILKVQQANAMGLQYLKDVGVDNAVIQLKSLEAFIKAADGKATKIIIPSEIQKLAGVVTSAVELSKE